MCNNLQEESKYPDIVRSFLNFFWVSLPSKWEIQTKFEGYFLNIKIISDKIIAGKQFYLRRRYSHDIMKKFQDTVDDLACDCAQEVVSAMKKII